MGYLKDEKLSARLFIACFLSYMAVTMCRSAYTSSLVALIGEGLLNKADGGLISGVFYAVYGILQIVFGSMCDRVSPLRMTTISLMLTVITTFLMSFLREFVAFLFVWGVLNAAAQAMLWPAILRVLSCVLAKEHRLNGTRRISYASVISAMASLMLSIVILKYGSWRGIYIWSAAISAFVTMYWIFTRTAVSKKLVHESEDSDIPVQKEEAEPHSFLKILLVSGIAFAIVPAMARATLDVGIRNWTPTMLCETFGVSASFSTLLTLLLSIGAFLGVAIGGKVFGKVKSEYICACIFYFFTAIFVALLLYMKQMGVYLSAVVIGLALTSISSLLQTFTVMIPVRFVKYNRVATVGGMINAVATVGCVVATYGLGYIAQHFGWGSMIAFWLGLMAVSFLLSLAGIRPWKRFTSDA